MRLIGTEVQVLLAFVSLMRDQESIGLQVSKMIQSL